MNIFEAIWLLVEMMGFGLARTARSVFRGRKRPPEVCSVPLPLRILAFFSNELNLRIRYFGGDDGIRTHDPLLAGQVLSQLSYTPIKWFVVISVSYPCE